MKKHIQIAVGILLLFATSTLSAQDSNVVRKLAQSIRSHKSMEVSFTYQTSGETEGPKEGKAYFQDNAYKVILEDQQTISDGETQWHYLVEDEEVMVGNATDDDSPFKILDELERDSSGITPLLDSKGNLKSLEIEVEDGVKTTLTIIEMRFDQDYPKDFFTFDAKAHPEVDVIDMR